MHSGAMFIPLVVKGFVVFGVFPWEFDRVKSVKDPC